MPDDRALVPLAELDALRAEVRDLRRQVEAMTPPRRRLNRDDEARALLMVPALAAAVGSRCFTVAELCQLAATDLPGAGAVRRAIVGAVGLDAGAGKRLGHLLRRLSGIAIAGVTIERIGDESSGAVWCVRQ